GRRQEAEPRDRERGGVERRRAERLHERTLLLVEAAAQDRLADRVTGGAPRPERRLEPQLFRQAQAAVDRRPAHQLRIDEVARAAAHLPEAAVGPLPGGDRKS